LFTDVQKVAIYPNPTSDIQTIIAEEGTLYSIIDMHGKERLEGMTTTNRQVDLSEMEPGVYFIQLANGIVQRIAKW